MKIIFSLIKMWCIAYTEREREGSTEISPKDFHLFRVIVFSATGKLIYCVCHKDASDLLFFSASMLLMLLLPPLLMMMMLQMYENDWNEMYNLHGIESQRFNCYAVSQKCTNKQSGSMHFTRAMHNTHAHYIISDSTQMRRFHQRAIVRMSFTHK